jgi:hypothetical protein
LNGPAHAVGVGLSPLHRELDEAVAPRPPMIRRG